MTWADFAQDQKTLYAVVRAFEIIGDASTRFFVSGTFQRPTAVEPPLPACESPVRRSGKRFLL
ncbi:hypothetical protein NITMOv2_1964 [Nitrospira moscoviensis]|uniref:Uncharacterized protein n=2 Tax=Nitrospira moscoviensis TaxID=42253 RepID=A0A0K2GBP0_NITMO|nr:hypothetical protein NITMOv2_1964 [Nitrospira moscoviensis]